MHCPSASSLIMNIHCSLVCCGWFILRKCWKASSGFDENNFLDMLGDYFNICLACYYTVIHNFWRMFVYICGIDCGFCVANTDFQLLTRQHNANLEVLFAFV